VRGRLRELLVLFVRLGLTAFGGPAAHIAMMEEEVVRRRRWLTREEFLDLLGATNLIPGPNSTEMVIHVGRLRAGVPGLLVAGAAFIAPAAAITLALAAAYERLGSLPRFEAVLRGVKPVVVAVVLQALLGLGRTAIRTRTLAALAIAAAVASALGGDELLVLLAAGGVAVLLRLRPGATAAAILPAGPALAAIGAASGGAAAAATPGGLFLVFLKIGSVLYGSGYVLLAFLRADLVERLGWLGEAQLLDAVAAGQVTPGPVFSTATFVGYLVAGVPGAAAATVGIFLPAFVFVAATGAIIPRIRRSPTAAAFLDGVNAASLALMAVVSFQLGRAAIVDLPTAAIAVVALVLLVRFKVNSAWLVLGGVAVGTGAFR
jgi:chromate transporter